MTDKNKNLLVRVGAVFLGVATIFLGALVVSEIRSYQYIGSDATQEATIAVSGEGEVLAKPDTGEFTVRIEEEAESVPEAQAGATEKNNDVIEFLKNNDVAESDIKTVNYNITPRYEYRQAADIGGPEGERVLQGYVVSQGLQVKVRDVESAGELLSGVGALNVSNVSGLNFTIDDEQEIENEARSKAIADAKTKAKDLAKELGVDLVQVVDFQESGGNPGSVYYSEDAARGGAVNQEAAPEVPTGENQFVSSVTLTYKIR